MSRLRVLAFCAVALFVTALPAAAAPFTFVHPSGGELMEGGCPYYIEWNGGPAGNVNLALIDLNTFTVAATLNNTPNDGLELWTLPDYLPTGPYEIYIEDTGVTTWTYGPNVTYEAPPACGPGCMRLSARGTTNFTCYADSAVADSVATVDAVNQLVAQCPQGYQVDFGTLRVDYRHWDPVFACPYPEHLTDCPATICCCPTVVPARPTTWGTLKTRYK